jgi:minor fimbrial subunit
MDKRLLIAMGRIIVLVVIIAYSAGAMAFQCRLNGGPWLREADWDFSVQLKPVIGPTENIIIDLSKNIECYNEADADAPGLINTDFIQIIPPTNIGVLNGFQSYIVFSGNKYSLPLTGDTQPHGFLANNYQVVPLPLSFVFSPIGAAGVQNISDGSVIGQFKMRKYYRNPPTGGYSYYIWTVRAQGSTVIPTGGCDVSARDVSVPLPPYDADSNQPFPVQLTVNCPSGDKQLDYTLSGTTDRSQTIFTNMAPAAPTPAQGVGIQMLDSNDNVITAGRPVSLGIVGPSSVDLKLKARYAQTGGQVTAGPVKSIIAVVFTYP